MSTKKRKRPYVRDLIGHTSLANDRTILYSMGGYLAEWIKSGISISPQYHGVAIDEADQLSSERVNVSYPYKNKGFCTSVTKYHAIVLEIEWEWG